MTEATRAAMHAACDEAERRGWYGGTLDYVATCHLAEVACGAYASGLQGDENAVEQVARHLAERDHGAPVDPATPVCEGYKEEARHVLASLAPEPAGATR
jgi:hypothetical protein